MSANPFAGRVSRRLYFARAALFWETAWPAFAPAVGVAGVFIVLALFDLLPLLPAALHAVVLFLFALAFALAALRAARALRLPAETEARRRIERESGLPHRPLEALADRPSGPFEPASAELWQAHRRRMAAALVRLKVGWPKASLAARDPRALRALLALLLVLGALDAGGAWRERVWRALVPNFAAGPAEIRPALDIWIVPPRYTGLPPRFLHPGEKGLILVPIGSRLLAEVHGGSSPPRLAVDGKSRPFAAVGKTNFRVEARLAKGHVLRVMEGGSSLGLWRIRILPDRPPKIAFAGPPKATPRGLLRIDFRASDDYGIEGAEAVIRPLGAGAGEKAVLRLPLPLYGGNPKRLAATSYFDLTASPWAGLPVEIRLAARDAPGGKGLSAPVRINLPQRSFENPVAGAIVALRKRLMAEPGSAESVAKALGALLARPQLYRGDRLVFLTLRVAEEELLTPAKRRTEVAGLLWQAALRVEEGRLPFAEARLRALEKRLAEALSGHAGERRIDRLMRRLEKAVREAFAAMAQNLARRKENGSAPLPSSRPMLERDLERLIERARELAANGDRAAARQLLSELRDTLENMRMLTRAERQALQREERAMGALRALMKGQQRLLDKSFRAGQKEAGEGAKLEGEGRSESAIAEAAEEEALKARLGAIMRALKGKSFPSLGLAQVEMGRAASALRLGQPGRAIKPQERALAELAEAARQLARAMARSAGAGSFALPGPGLGPYGKGGKGVRDPRGREFPGYGLYDSGEVKIPSRARINEARKILEELRRREGEPWRAPVERRYLDRLLQQF